MQRLRPASPPGGAHANRKGCVTQANGGNANYFGLDGGRLFHAASNVSEAAGAIAEAKRSLFGSKSSIWAIKKHASAVLKATFRKARQTIHGAVAGHAVSI